MKKLRCTYLLTAFLLCVLLAAAGCGNKASYGYENDSSADTMQNSYAYNGETAGVLNSDADRGETVEVLNADTSQKIIYTANVSIETKKFTESYQALTALAAGCGGYISDTDTSGGYNDRNGDYVTSRAYLTVRIPADRFEEFLNAAGDIGTVTSRTSYQQDITADYIDTSSRIEALTAQKEQLMQYLRSAENVTEMLEIQDRLYDVIYELESYQSRIDAYDEQISYSTVYISLTDVSNITSISKTFGEDFTEAVRNSWRSVVNFLQGLAIVIIWIIPYALVIGAIVLIIMLIIRTIKKKFPPSPERQKRAEERKTDREARREARRARGSDKKSS